MGVIFRAEDTRLGRTVALKLLPPDLTRDPLAKARFLQEARSASSLDHPNVCSIYEVGETDDLQLYLVMPLYDGETLRQRIDRGPLPIAEALDIAHQIAQGLAKAHQRGIVHRDVKPSNLMITADGPVKILDFGVAKLQGGEGLTRTGSVVGTPAYMSPEQMRGDDVDERTDLWSLGVVIYEMVTGRRPFRGDQETALREAILYATPERLAVRRSEVSAELDRLVAGLLTKDPAARTAPAESVARTLRSLAGEPSGPRTLWQRASRTSKARRRLVAVLGLLSVLILAAALGLTRWQRVPDRLVQPERSTTAESERRLSLLVIGFRDLAGGDPARGWLGPALTEMMTTELAAGARVRVVSSDHAALVRKSLDLSSVEAPDRAALDRLHSLAGTDLAVVGAYLPLDGREGRRLRLDVRVLALPEGDTVASVAEVGTESELFDLVARTGERLRRALGLSLLTEEQAREARQLLPSGSAAIRLYAEALVRLRSYDLGPARDLLLQAEKLDPDSAAIQSALTETWALLGHDARARESAAKAFQLRASLSQEARLAIEAQLYKAEKQWVRASGIYRTLWTFFPDDMDYGLQLVSTLIMEGRGGEAISTLTELRKLPAPGGDDPRIDLLEAQAARRMSDFVRQERAGAAAVAKSRRAGALVIAAQGLTFQGDALVSSGRVQEALVLFRQAESIAYQVGNQWTIGMATSNIGTALHGLGRLREAAEVNEKSLAIAREIGTVAGLSAQLFTLGMLDREQGKLAQGRERLEQSREWYLKTGDRLMVGRTEQGIALICLAQGNLERTEKLLVSALDISRQVGSRVDEVRILEAQATLRSLRGDLREARRLQEEALQILRGLTQPALAASVLGASADLLARNGDPRLAQRRLDQALAAERKSGNVLLSGRLLEIRADLACRKADVATCRSAGQAALALAREVGARPLEAAALRTLARAARASGQPTQARDLLRECLRLSQEMGDALSAAASRLDLARLALEQGENATAESLAREAADWYGDRRLLGGQAAATALLADSLLRRGRRPEAQAAAERARALLPEADRVWDLR